MVEAARCVRASSYIQRMINENNVAFGQGPSSHSNRRDLLSAIGSPCRICCSQIPIEGQRSLLKGKAATCAAPQSSTGPCLGLGRGEDPGWQPVAGCLHLVRAGDRMPSLTKQSPGMLPATSGQAPSPMALPAGADAAAQHPLGTVLRHQVSISSDQGVLPSILHHSLCPLATLTWFSYSQSALETIFSCKTQKKSQTDTPKQQGMKREGGCGWGQEGTIETHGWWTPSSDPVSSLCRWVYMQHFWLYSPEGWIRLRQV